MTRDQIRDLFIAGHLDAWIELEREMDRLTRLAEIAQTGAEQLQTKHEIDRSQWRAKEQSRWRDVEALHQRLADQTSATRRACGQVAQVTRALRALVDLMCDPKYAAVQASFGGEVHRCVAHAQEVLALIEVPFG